MVSAPGWVRASGWSDVSERLGRVDGRRTGTTENRSGLRGRGLAAALAMLLLAGLSPVSAFATDTPGDGMAGAAGAAGEPGSEPALEDGHVAPREPVEDGAQPSALDGSEVPATIEPNGDRPDAHDDPAVTELIETAEEEGTVRVIVTLRETRAMAGPADAARRRGAIGELQRDVLARLPARADVRGRALPHGAAEEARGVRAFSLSPGLALDVTPTELEALLADPDVVSVSEDGVVQPLLAASGVRIGRVATGPYAGTFNGHTGQGWAVAILDSGVNRGHFALRGGPGVIHEACFSANNFSYRSLCGNGASTQIGRGAAPDCLMSLLGCGHGTHVASTAAAMDHRLSSIVRLRSVAHRSPIVAVQVFSEARFAGSIVGRFSDIVAGMEHLYLQRGSLGRPLAAVNLSLGIDGETWQPDEQAACDAYVAPFTTAAANLRAAGIAVVAASGNDDATNGLTWPACVSTVISVGSTRTSNDAVSTFTNTSAALDLLAPGQQITAAYQSAGRTASIGTLQGTSMAAPHVAGAFAVLREAVGDAPPVDDLLELLQETGVDVARGGSSWPRIDLAAAVAEVATANAPTRPSLRLRRGLLQAGWRAPARGPVLPAGYTLQVDDGSGWRDVCGPLTLSQHGCTVPASDLLEWGIPHAVRVRTDSAFRSSAWIAVGTATPFTVPDTSAAPLALTPTFRAITVSWSGLGDLAVARGAPVTQVQVRAAPVGGRSRTCSASSGRSELPSSCTMTRLTSGLSHSLEIRMRNAAGWSVWTPIGSATPD
jgi:subtilisin family serine protease